MYGSYVEICEIIVALQVLQNKQALVFIYKSIKDGHVFKPVVKLRKVIN